MVCSRLLSRWVFLLGLSIAGAGLACQVPVFRYALERWEPSPYRLTLIPPVSGLSEAEKATLETLRKASTAMNLELDETAPPQEAPAASLQLFHPHQRHEPGQSPVWTSALTAEATAALADSPLRQELCQRLLTGQSAIWLLLESGDAAKDDAALRTLEQSLAAAQDQIELPDGVITQEQANTATDPKLRESADILYTDLPLAVTFSTLRLSRDNPAEQALLAMLLRVEPDLGDFTDEPMAFAIFGRGRALEPLIGAGLNADNVLEACSYLCGACSCEIKEQNPGMDLLLTADWSAVDNAPKIESVNTQPAATGPAIVIPPDAPLSTKILLVLAALGCVAGAAWLFRRHG
jgi:hypothetical protein